MESVDAFEELRRGLQGDRRRDDERAEPVRRGHLFVGGAIALSLGLAVVLTSALRPASSDAAKPIVDEAETTEPSATATSTAESASARVWPAEPVEILGTEVRTGGHRWNVGVPGDLVAVGDWDCDGTPTPAIVRPAANRFFVFDDWATEGTTTKATAGPTVPAGVTDVAAEGCGRAALRTADGRTHLVAIGGAR